MSNDPENSNNPKVSSEDSHWLRAVWGIGMGAIIYGESLIDQNYGSEIVAYGGAVIIGYGSYNLIKAIKQSDEASTQ